MPAFYLKVCLVTRDGKQRYCSSDLGEDVVAQGAAGVPGFLQVPVQNRIWILVPREHS
jgi:hypothetical protein